LPSITPPIGLRERVLDAVTKSMKHHAEGE
jgi:hypothetical protein